MRIFGGHVLGTEPAGRALVPMRGLRALEGAKLEAFVAELDRRRAVGVVQLEDEGALVENRARLAPHAQTIVLGSYLATEVIASSASGFRTALIMRHDPSPEALAVLQSLYGFEAFLADGDHLGRRTIEAAHALGLEVGALVEDRHRRAELVEAGIDAIVSERERITLAPVR